MKILVFLLLISTSIFSQRTNDEILSNNIDNAQLAVDWLTKGNIEKYNFYKKNHPKFNAFQLFELSNVLEEWVDNNKNSAFILQASKELIDEVEKKNHQDPFGRQVILYEINAMANANLGNSSVALQQIEKSGTLNSPFRQMAYFRNSTANYLTRYGAILSAAGQHRRALDTLSNAVRSAASTSQTIKVLREVYKKVHGNADANKYIKTLQNEAYHKIYKDVEKAWLAKTIPTPDIALSDMNGKTIKLTDYKGKIVVIDFWSTTCKPCVAAFPAFERIVELYKDEPFQLFVVNVGESPDIVQPFMDKKDYHLQVLFDDNEALFNALNTIGTPQKFIIDTNGNINQTAIGYAGSDDKEFYKLKAMVELAKEKSKAN